MTVEYRSYILKDKDKSFQKFFKLYLPGAFSKKQFPGDQIAHILSLQVETVSSPLILIGSNEITVLSGYLH